MEVAVAYLDLISWRLPRPGQYNLVINRSNMAC
jgi:hypothetical protein